MCKKIIITIGILLCALNSIAFAEKERLTRTDYLNLLNEYIKESNIKINTVYKTYEDKITANLQHSPFLNLLYLPVLPYQ